MRPEPFVVPGAHVTCERCGQAHTKCTAHTRAGNPCRQNPVTGMTVCRMHGGSSPQARKAANRRMARAAVERSLADVEVIPVGDPLEALADLAAEAVAWKGHLADVVAELRDQYRFTDQKGSENLDARVALFERAMDRCHKFLSDWVRLGFEERKAQLDDARALLVRTVLIGVLTELGHEIDTPATHDTLARWLPVLDGEPPPAISA